MIILEKRGVLAMRRRLYKFSEKVYLFTVTDNDNLI